MKMKFVRVSVDDNEKFSSLFKWFVELGRNEKKKEQQFQNHLLGIFLINIILLALTQNLDLCQTTLLVQKFSSDIYIE